MRKLVLPKYFGRPSIGLALFGCANRPFYHICVFPDRALGRRSESSILEQVGTFDPLPNVRNEKLVALNIGRIKYWIGERNAHISVPVLELLGLCGLFPIHPKTFIRARNCRRLAEAAAQQAALKKEAEEKAKEEKNETQESKTGGKEKTGGVEREQLKEPESENKDNQLKREEDKAEKTNDSRGKEGDDSRVEARPAKKITEDSANDVEIFKRVDSEGEYFPDQLNYSLERDTMACDDLQLLYPNIYAAPCEDADLDVTISSIPVLPNGTNILPYVNLNISALVHTPCSHVFFRLQCLEAPDHDDQYCHDHEAQIRKWGRMIWPCRALSVSKMALIRLPFRFGYHCFRLFGHSHYLINVSLVPPLCTSSLIVTIPLETQLHSSIAQFYNGDLFNPTDWSPLVIVDLTPTDGVWLRYERPSDRRIKQMTFTIYEKRDTSNKFVFTEILDAPNSGFKWTNVPAGNYSAFVYVNRHDCSLLCSDGDSGCIICPHTMVKFSIIKDKYTTAWRNLRSVANFAKVLALALLGVLLLAALLMLSALIYARISRSRCQHVERDIVLTQRPTILLIYADDCVAHSSCILVLAKFLEDFANAIVHVDQLELNTAGVIPTRWLVDMFAKSKFVIVVFSEGSQLVLEGKTLQCGRPFPDLFDTAINHVISELNRHIASQRAATSRVICTRFIFLHMSYSPSSVIPPNIAAFPVRILSIPAQVGELIAHLHEQPVGSRIVHQANTTQLESAIEEVLAFRRSNPSWLENRIAQNVDKEAVRADISSLPLSEPQSFPSFDEQIRLARDFNIEPPDVEPTLESGIGVDESRFALIGSPDDESDSS
uniref:Small ribosomal subunit protein bS16m n=1 Tax=Ascaris lumbricoides TaxID=6252 RepID=A0A9J2PAX8_ASCLU